MYSSPSLPWPLLAEECTDKLKQPKSITVINTLLLKQSVEETLGDLNANSIALKKHPSVVAHMTSLTQIAPSTLLVQVAVPIKLITLTVSGFRNLLLKEKREDVTPSVSIAATTPKQLANPFVQNYRLSLPPITISVLPKRDASVLERPEMKLLQPSIISLLLLIMSFSKHQLPQKPTEELPLILFSKLNQEQLP